MCNELVVVKAAIVINSSKNKVLLALVFQPAEVMYSGGFRGRGWCHHQPQILIFIWFVGHEPWRGTMAMVQSWFSWYDRLFL